MNRKTANVNRLRLSPNEEAQFVRDDLDRRRKLRVQQVREQERYIALQVRREVRDRKEKELQNVAVTLRHEWQMQRSEKIKTLEKLHADSCWAVGQGYRNAQQNETDWDASARKREQNKERATARHQQALRDLAFQRQSEKERHSRHIEARKKALIVEKRRAVKVASLPQPVPNPIESIGIHTSTPPSMVNLECFSITYCHEPETTDAQETVTKQSDAKQAAKLEAERLSELEKEKVFERQEQLERAQLRGERALQKEKIIQGNASLLLELERLQQADFQQRRQIVNNIPAQVFQPLYRHGRIRAEQQRELDIAFQDLYNAERKIQGSLIPQPVPEPLPAPSGRSNDVDLDGTLDSTYEDNVTFEASPCKEAEKEAASSQRQSIVSFSSLNSGQPALRRLFAHIKKQRDQWCCQKYPAGRERAVLDNTSIETGSLSNPEWENTVCVESDKYALHKAGPKVSEESIIDWFIPHLEKWFTETSRRVHGKALAHVSDGLQSQTLQNYQQRLLEQNRLQKKSVEDAHCQLEEYQKKLQLRYFVTTTTTQSPQPPLTEETCFLCSFDGQDSPAITSLPVTEADCSVSLDSQTAEGAQSPHKFIPTGSRSSVDPALVSQPALHTPSSALSTLPSVANPFMTSYAYMPKEVLNTTSLFPEHCLSLNFTQPPVSLALQGSSMALLQGAKGLPARKSVDGPFDIREMALPHPSVVVQHLLTSTNHIPPAPVSKQCSVDNVPLAVRPPMIVPRSEFEEGVSHCSVPEIKSNQWVKEEMSGQKLVALPRTEYTETSHLTLKEALTKATEKSNTLHLHSTSPGPLLKSLGSDARVKPPVSRPPRTVQILLQDMEPHELSTIQEMDTPVHMTQHTGSEDSPGPSSNSVLISHTSTCRASKLSWRDTLQLETADTHTSGCTVKQRHLEKLQLALLHDEATDESDYMASITISTGSYSTSENDLNQTITGGSVSTVAAGQCTVMCFGPERDTESLNVPMQQSTQYPLEHRNSLSTTMQDTFQPLSSKIKFNSMTEFSMSPQLPVDVSLCCPLEENSTTDADPATSQWLDKTGFLNLPDCLQADAQCEHALQMSMEQLFITNYPCHGPEKVCLGYADNIPEPLQPELPANKVGSGVTGPASCNQCERVQKHGCEKGILEESVISLVSLSNTTLEDDYPTSREEKDRKK